MAISKKAKIWIGVLSIPLCIVALIIIAAKLYFTSDRLKALIIPEIEQLTHRTVSVKDISLSVFPSIAISIEDVKLSNPQGIQFQKEEFLSIKNMRLNVKLFELLQNNIVISYIIVDHPKVYLEMNKDGMKNYSSGSATRTTAGKEQTQRSKSGGILLSNLEIIDGEIEYVDYKYESRLRMTGLHHIADVAAKPGENNVHIQGTTSLDKLSYGSLSMWYLSELPVSGTSKLTYAIVDDILRFDDVVMKVKDLPLTISGTIAQLQQKTLKLDLTITSPEADMAKLLSLAPAAMLKKSEGLSSTGNVEFSLSVNGNSDEMTNPGIQCKFSVINGKIHYASLPKSINNVNLKGSFEKPSAPIGTKGIGSFELEALTATLGSATLNGNMKLANFDDPNLVAALKGKLNLGEVKEYYPLEPGTELNGGMSMNINIDGKPQSPQTIKASGTAEFQNVTMKTAGSATPIHNLSGNVQFNNQVIESKHLSVNIGESDLALAFTLKNYLGMILKEGATSSSKPSATVSLISKQLHTADLLSEETLEEKANKDETITENKTGFIPGIDIDANVSIDRLVTQKFVFENTRGTAAIANGIINLKNMSLNAFGGAITTKGMLDLRDPKKSPFQLDLDIKQVESNALLSEFTSFGQYLFGKFSIKTTLKGDLNDTLGLHPQTLFGDGTVDIASGKLMGFPLTQKIADYTSLTELREINFKDWTNAFLISNGRLNIKDLKVNAGEIGFLLGGSQGLDGSMDYLLTVKLPSSFSDRIKLGGGADQLLQFFKDKDGRINLTFDVGGTSTNPTVKLNAKAQEEAAKAALLRKTDEAKNKLEDDLKKKAEEGLKKLFKRP